MTNQKELRYFLYARKSSESEDRQVASIDDQQKEVLKIAEELQLNIVGTFSESKSAKSPGRSVFNDMLLRIEKNEADAILCWKLNRLARNPVDGGKISWMLQNNIIKHIQCFGRDYKPSDNVLMMQVELGMANQFVKDLSVDVKRGMRQKAERGWNPFPTLPLGYIHNKDPRGKVLSEEIIPDKKRFSIIKRLWKLMLTGTYSIADIKRKADEFGLVNDNEKPYVVHTFHKLFSTEFYYGHFYWKDQNGNKKRFKGKHKKMVSEQEFDKVQCFIGNHKRPTRIKKYNYTYRGLLSCGECGCKITAERKFQVRCTGCRYKFSCLNRNTCPKCELPISEMQSPTVIDQVYYRCTKRKGKCSQKTIREEDLAQQYAQAIKEIEITDDFYNYVIGELKNINHKEQAEDFQIVAELKKKKKTLENRLNGINLMRADGDLDTDQFYKMKETTATEIESLKKQIQLESKEINWLANAEDCLNFVLKASEMMKKEDYFDKKAVLMQLGSNQTLVNQKLHFIRAKPLLAIKECFEVFMTKKSRFEPENPLVNKGDSTGFDATNASLCTRVHNVRTSMKYYPDFYLESA